MLYIPLVTPLVNGLFGTLFGALNISGPIVKSNIKQPSIADVASNFNYINVFPCDSSVLTNWSCRACKLIPNNKYITKLENDLTRTEGYITVDTKSKYIVTVFRGTNDINEMLLDLIFVPLRLDGIYHPPFSVNLGFFTAMKSLYPQFSSQIKQLRIQYPDYKLKFVGHSLGGAMASLGLLKIKEETKLSFDKFELYTYGQPRTGDSVFAKWYDEQILSIARVVNYNDLFPKLPPRELLDYAHHGNELFIDPFNTTTPMRYCSNDRIEDPTCSASIGLFSASSQAHIEYFNMSNFTTC